MSIHSQKNRFALIVLLFLVFSCLIYHLIDNDKSTALTSSHLEPIIVEPVDDNDEEILKPSNLRYSIPALWIFGPAKTSTTSIYTALADSFPNWYHPEPNKPFREYPQIWTKFLTENYFGSLKKDYYFQKLVTFLDDNIIKNKSIQTLDEYPFYDILLLLKPYIIEKQIKKQNSIFSDIINASKYNNDMLVIVKTPAHFYSPFIPIIFAYYISPIDYIQNQYGTKVLILLRNSVKRTISWYSLFYIKKFMNGYNNDENAVFDLIRYQLNNSLNYKPLKTFRNMIIDRNTEYDDILILNEYFKFFYGFSRLFKKCNAMKFNININNECKEIDIGLYSEEWNYKNMKYQYINHVRHPIHMIFVGMSYPHLLLPLIVFKQNKMLGIKFKFMLFNYIINNHKEALYLMTCWSEGRRQCDIHQFKYKNKNIWNNINLPHQKHETLGIPQDIKYLLSEYYKPITIRINELLNRFNENNDIFLGEWTPSNW